MGITLKLVTCLEVSLLLIIISFNGLNFYLMLFNKLCKNESYKLLHGCNDGFNTVSFFFWKIQVSSPLLVLGL